jgi:hypothetical protein
MHPDESRHFGHGTDQAAIRLTIQHEAVEGGPSTDRPTDHPTFEHEAHRASSWVVPRRRSGLHRGGVREPRRFHAQWDSTPRLTRSAKGSPVRFAMLLPGRASRGSSGSTSRPARNGASRAWRAGHPGTCRGRDLVGRADGSTQRDRVREAGAVREEVVSRHPGRIRRRAEVLHLRHARSEWCIQVQDPAFHQLHRGGRRRDLRHGEPWTPSPVRPVGLPRGLPSPRRPRRGSRRHQRRRPRSRERGLPPCDEAGSRGSLLASPDPFPSEHPPRFKRFSGLPISSRAICASHGGSRSTVREPGGRGHVARSLATSVPVGSVP